MQVQNVECGAQSGTHENQDGFTLIEAVLTLVILSIAAVGVLSVFTVGFKGSSNPLMINQAIGLAQGEMEQVVGAKMAPGGFAAIATGASITCTAPMLTGFACSRTVYYVNANDLNTSVGGPTQYKHVRVMITNPAIGNVGVETIITDY